MEFEKTFGAPAFDRICTDDYLPAFRAAIAETRAEIDGITSSPAAPTFENTIEALEYAGRSLDGVENIFFNLLEADSNPQMQEIAEAISPELTALQMYIMLNDTLFQRIKTVHDAHPVLEPDQRKLLEDTYRSFVRNGALLSPADKERYAGWSERLSLLELRFGKHVLEATNAFSLHLTDTADLEGLPEHVVEAGAANAHERGLDGWVYTLQFPSYNPFMTYSARRDLRERMYRAYASRAVGGSDDNVAVIREIVDLRARMAHLLGYPDYASYALEERMAKNVSAVRMFLDRLMTPSLPEAKREVAEIESFAIEHGFDGERLEAWDFKYWSERLKQARFDLDESLLKPYFPLDRCIDAVFGLAGRLYGLTFTERHDVPVYHPDVRVYAVKEADGSHLALFYADFFPRESKRSGAWMTEFRGQYRQGGTDFRPFVSIVTNFSKPAAGKPSLLTHDELTTLLHEFGHALHGMLSKGRYPSQCGTNVARDFVELPSQIMENWACEPEFLRTFATHYLTGAPLPEERIGQIVAARNYLAGYQQVRQLQFGIIDMAWHTLQEPPREDAVAFERKVLSPYRTLPPVDGTAQSPSFNHIFSGGYSAGYYSYKWAEVLEADAFEAFKEHGIFDRATADSFRTCILERGSSVDEMTSYIAFRGHAPEPDALLRKLGIAPLTP